MPRIYHLSKTATRIFYKIRHHKGHGVHSPFVYNFITKVIEEKTPYYAYDDISSYLQSIGIDRESTKTERLLFKTVNYFNPINILELGAGDGINTLYLTAASSHIKCVSVEQNKEKLTHAKEIYKGWKRDIKLCQKDFPKLEEKQDCILLNLRNYEADHGELKKYLFENVNENSFIFIDGIRTNRKQQALWKSLIEADDVLISFDLFHIGILFFNKKYFKKNYKLSF